MANQQPIARAAAGLEALARALPRRAAAVGRRRRASRWRQAVEEFRLLVRRVREWSDAETARTVRLGLSLEAAGRPARRGERRRRRSTGDLHTGVRAFVAREGALIASALDRAARGRSAPHPATASRSTP